MNGIQLDQNYEGFAQGNGEMMEMLTKALSAGSGVDAASYTGGRALIPESLDSTLVNILHTQDEARLFQMLKKNSIKSPVHQWDERTEVGADDGAWVPEGGDSTEADQTIARKYGTAKYLQTLRKVTLQATISNMIEPAMVLEQNAGTLWIIRNIERALFYGNSTFFTNQPDGLETLIPSSNVIDARGADASSSIFENAFNEGCRQIRDNYGRASDFLASTKVMEDVQRLLRDRIRFGAGTTQGSAVFTEYPTPFGTPTIKDDIFIQEGAVGSASSLTALRPAAITFTSVTPSSSPSTSQFSANDAGDYWYSVAGVNRYGQGAETIYGSPTAVTVAADEIVTMTVTDGSPVPTCYALFRSKKDAADLSDLRFIGYFAWATGTSDTFIDTNSDLPGTSDGYLLTMGQIYNAIEWEQFLPLMKFDLYPTNAAVYPFLMLLFGFLALKKPVQHIRIKNISPSGLGWF